MARVHEEVYAAACRVTQGRYTGSAVALGPWREVPGGWRGTVLTCAHVVEDSKPFHLQWPAWKMPDRTQKCSFSDVTFRDLARDLCLVDATLSKKKFPESPPSLELRDELPMLGDPYMMLGFPRLVSRPRLTRGFLAARDSFSIYGVDTPCFVLDGAAFPGNSGGPVCDEAGRVHAILNAGPKDPAGLNGAFHSGEAYATPVVHLPRLLEQTRAHTWNLPPKPGKRPRIKVPATSLAELQEWLTDNGASPIAAMTCNSDEEIWLHPGGAGRVSRKDREYVDQDGADAAQALTRAFLKVRPKGGRMLFNGATLWGYLPHQAGYEPLVDVSAVGRR